MTEKLQQELDEDVSKMKKLVTKVELIYPRGDEEAQGKAGGDGHAKGRSEKEKKAANTADDAAKEHRGFGFVSFVSQKAMDTALKLQIVKGGRKPTSKKLYTMHLRPYHDKTEQEDEEEGHDVCYLWSLHRCPYGNECKFQHIGPGGCHTNHPQDELTQKERLRKKKGKCFAYKKGKCTKGDDCPFSHDIELNPKEKSNEERQNNDKSSISQSNEQKDCINWKTKGKCRKGDKCEYRHDPELQKKALKKLENKKRKRDEAGVDSTSGKHANKEKQPLAVRVFGLLYACTEDDVREFFKDCGIITKILFPTFEDSGRSKGYCGIWFASPKAVAKALELDGAEFQGRWLRIQSGKSMELEEWEGLHKNRQTKD